MAGSPRVTINHVGQCVSDLDRAQAFYEGVFGFRVALELDVPDAASSLLRLTPPVGMTARYLVRDGFVLELLHYADKDLESGPDRVMNHAGLTHISFGVDDLDETIAAISAHGGEVLDDTNVGVAVFAKDPDGQLLELLTGWQKPTNQET